MVENIELRLRSERLSRQRNEECKILLVSSDEELRMEWENEHVWCKFKKAVVGSAVRVCVAVQELGGK